MASQNPETPLPADAPRRTSLFKKILLAVLVLVLLVIAVIAMQPSTFQIARSTEIAAAPAKVFDNVNDFHNWERWSPWVGLDPDMDMTYDGEPAGTGAIYRWKGNQEVGEGQMTIVESRPNDLIRIKLEFFKPFAATNEAQFAFEPKGDDATRVTWSMAGDNNFAMKAVHLMMDMDKMLGSDFDKGLARMKADVESPAKP